jgi:hypothetical protein
VRTDLDAKNSRRKLCFRRSFARYAAWPRRDRRRSSKVLASPISGHLSSYPITTPRFFFHASHEYPPISHDHIPLIYPSALAVIWHLCISSLFFLILCASCFPLPTPSRSSIHTLIHTPTHFLSCFSFFSSGLEHGSEPLDSSHRSLRGIAQCPFATCCLYVLPLVFHRVLFVCCCCCCCFLSNLFSWHFNWRVKFVRNCCSGNLYGFVVRVALLVFKPVERHPVPSDLCVFRLKRRRWKWKVG